MERDPELRRVMSCANHVIVTLLHSQRVLFSTRTMPSSDTCYTIVFESASESPSVSDLRSALEKGSDDVKIDTLRKLIVSTINGNPQASLQLLFYDLRV